MQGQWVIDRTEQAQIVVDAGLRKCDAHDWYVKWRGVVRNARHREIECTLTFKQYIRLAARAGLTRPTDIGMAIDQYNLGRKGDTGGYVLGNCRFITSKRNRRERVLNGCMDAMAEAMRGQTKENSPRMARMAESKRGRTKENDEGVRRISEALTGRTKETHAGLAAMAEKRSRSFRAKSPDGVVYKSRNLLAFCKEHNLTQSAMDRTCRGRQTNHKGWTGKYLP